MSDSLQKTPENPPKPPPPASSVLAPAVPEDYNRTGLDFRRPMPRPKVQGHGHRLPLPSAGRAVTPRSGSRPPTITASTTSSP